MTELINDAPDLVVLGDIRKDGTPDATSTLFTFPVPHGEMRVRQAVKLDQVEIPGRSGKVKQATGYEDAEVEIRLQLVDEEDKSGGTVRTAIEQLRTLQKAFRNRRAKDTLPRVFSIRSRLTDACEIKTVLFVGVEASETPGANDLDVTISFVEFEPIARQVERQATAAVAANQAAKDAGAAADAAGIDSQLGSENPLAKAYRDGRETALGGPFEGERPGDDPEANP